MFSKINLFKRRVKNAFLRRKGVQIGEGTIIITDKGNFSSEPYLVKIGKNCLISGNVLFCPHDGGNWVMNRIYSTDFDKIAPITIRDNVYIGFGALIMGGVTIGENSIVGADSVVTHNVPPNSVVAGVPAKLICSLGEYKEKNLAKFDRTVNLSPKEKRLYFEKKYPGFFGK